MNKSGSVSMVAPLLESQRQVNFSGNLSDSKKIEKIKKEHLLLTENIVKVEKALDHASEFKRLRQVLMETTQDVFDQQQLLHQKINLYQLRKQIYLNLLILKVEINNAFVPYKDESRAKENLLKPHKYRQCLIDQMIYNAKLIQRIQNELNACINLAKNLLASNQLMGTKLATQTGEIFKNLVKSRIADGYLPKELNFNDEKFLTNILPNEIKESIEHYFLELKEKQTQTEKLFSMDFEMPDIDAVSGDICKLYARCQDSIIMTAALYDDIPLRIQEDLAIITSKIENKQQEFQSKAAKVILENEEVITLIHKVKLAIQSYLIFYQKSSSTESQSRKNSEVSSQPYDWSQEENIDKWATPYNLIEQLSRYLQAITHYKELKLTSTSHFSPPWPKVWKKLCFIVGATYSADFSISPEMLEESLKLEILENSSFQQLKTIKLDSRLRAESLELKHSDLRMQEALGSEKTSLVQAKLKIFISYLGLQKAKSYEGVSSKYFDEISQALTQLVKSLENILSKNQADQKKLHEIQQIAKKQYDQFLFDEQKLRTNPQILWDAGIKIADILSIEIKPIASQDSLLESKNLLNNLKEAEADLSVAPACIVNENDYKTLITAVTTIDVAGSWRQQMQDFKAMMVQYMPAAKNPVDRTTPLSSIFECRDVLMQKMQKYIRSTTIDFSALNLEQMREAFAAFNSLTYNSAAFLKDLQSYRKIFYINFNKFKVNWLAEAQLEDQAIEKISKQLKSDETINTTKMSVVFTELERQAKKLSIIESLIPSDKVTTDYDRLLMAIERFQYGLKIPVQKKYRFLPNKYTEFCKNLNRLRDNLYKFQSDASLCDAHQVVMVLNEAELNIIDELVKYLPSYLQTCTNEFENFIDYNKPQSQIVTQEDTYLATRLQLFSIAFDAREILKDEKASLDTLESTFVSLFSETAKCITFKESKNYSNVLSFNKQLIFEVDLDNPKKIQKIRQKLHLLIDSIDSFLPENCQAPLLNLYDLIGNRQKFIRESPRDLTKEFFDIFNTIFIKIGGKIEASFYKELMSKNQFFANDLSKKYQNLRNFIKMILDWMTTPLSSYFNENKANFNAISILLKNKTIEQKDKYSLRNIEEIYEWVNIGNTDPDKIFLITLLKKYKVSENNSTDFNLKELIKEFLLATQGIQNLAIMFLSLPRFNKPEVLRNVLRELIESCKGLSLVKKRHFFKQKIIKLIHELIEDCFIKEKSFYAFMGTITGIPKPDSIEKIWFKNLMNVLHRLNLLWSQLSEITMPMNEAQERLNKHMIARRQLQQNLGIELKSHDIDTGINSHQNFNQSTLLVKKFLEKQEKDLLKLYPRSEEKNFENKNTFIKNSVPVNFDSKICTMRDVIKNIPPLLSENLNILLKELVHALSPTPAKIEPMTADIPDLISEPEPESELQININQHPEINSVERILKQLGNIDRCTPNQLPDPLLYIIQEKMFKEFMEIFLSPVLDQSIIVGSEKNCSIKRREWSAAIKYYFEQHKNLKIEQKAMRTIASNYVQTANPEMRYEQSLFFKLCPEKNLRVALLKACKITEINNYEETLSIFNFPKSTIQNNLEYAAKNLKTKIYVLENKASSSIPKLCGSDAHKYTQAIFLFKEERNFSCLTPAGLLLEKFSRPREILRLFVQKKSQKAVSILSPLRGDGSSEHESTEESSFIKPTEEIKTLEAKKPAIQKPSSLAFRASDIVYSDKEQKLFGRIINAIKLLSEPKTIYRPKDEEIQQQSILPLLISPIKLFLRVWVNETMDCNYIDEKQKNPLTIRSFYQQILLKALKKSSLEVTPLTRALKFLLSLPILKLPLGPSKNLMWFFQLNYDVFKTDSSRYFQCTHEELLWRIMMVVLPLEWTAPWRDYLDFGEYIKRELSKGSKSKTPQQQCSDTFNVQIIQFEGESNKSTSTFSYASTMIYLLKDNSGYYPMISAESLFNEPNQIFALMQQLVKLRETVSAVKILTAPDSPSTQGESPSRRDSLSEFPESTEIELTSRLLETPEAQDDDKDEPSTDTGHQSLYQKALSLWAKPNPVSPDDELTLELEPLHLESEDEGKATSLSSSISSLFTPRTSTSSTRTQTYSRVNSSSSSSCSSSSNSSSSSSVLSTIFGSKK